MLCKLRLVSRARSRVHVTNVGQAIARLKLRLQLVAVITLAQLLVAGGIPPHAPNEVHAQTGDIQRFLQVSDWVGTYTVSDVGVSTEPMSDPSGTYIFGMAKNIHRKRANGTFTVHSLDTNGQTGLWRGSGTVRVSIYDVGLWDWVEEGEAHYNHRTSKGSGNGILHDIELDVDDSGVQLLIGYDGINVQNRLVTDNGVLGSEEDRSTMFDNWGGIGNYNVHGIMHETGHAPLPSSGLAVDFHDNFVDDKGFTNYISWHIAPAGKKKCANRVGPIMDADPGIDDVQVALDATKDSITPAGLTSLVATVTCGGIAVQNAPIKFTVQVEPRTGGHVHDNVDKEGNPRPDGCLNRAKITKQHLSIDTKTDNQGKVDVVFQPGTNEDCGSTRGIAGTYKVTATYVSNRFPDRQADRAIEVAREDFVPLPPSGQHYFVRRGDSDVHPSGTFGTQTTINGLQHLADDFWAEQVSNNQKRAAAGLKKWGDPVPLSINDISLQQGGLFDVFGFNVKKQKLTGDPWHPPHFDHLDGVGVDINTANFPSSTVGGVDENGQKVKIKHYTAQGQYLFDTLERLGARYGTWEAGEPTLHLKVSRSLPIAVTPLPLSRVNLSAALLQAGSPFPRVTIFGQLAGFQATEPDLSVAIFQSDPDSSLTVTAGQLVTYTIGIDNLNGATAAHDVMATVALAKGLRFLNSARIPTRQESTNQVTWDLGTVMPQDDPLMFDVVAQAQSDAVPGTVLTASVQIATTDTETNLDNNHDDALDLVVQPVGPDLVAYSDLGAASMTTEAPVTFTVQVANLGNALATASKLNLTLPPGVGLLSASMPTLAIGSSPATPVPTPGVGSIKPATSPKTISWSLGDLSPHDSPVVTISVQLDPALAAALPLDPATGAAPLITYTIGVQTSGSDFDLSDNNLVVVKPLEALGSDAAVWLGVEGAGDSGTLSAGQDVTYTLRYANLGNVPATESTLTMSLGSGLRLVSAQPSMSRTDQSTDFPGGIFTWTLGQVAVGESGDIPVRIHVATVPDDGALAVATIHTTAFDTDPFNNDVRELRQAASQVETIPSPQVTTAGATTLSPTADTAASDSTAVAQDAGIAATPEGANTRSASPGASGADSNVIWLVAIGLLVLLGVGVGFWWFSQRKLR